MLRRTGLLVLAALALSALALPAGDAIAKKKKKKTSAVKLGPVVTASATATVTPGGRATATASCPANTTLVSGGFAAEPVANAEGTLPADSHAAGNRWQVTGTKGVFATTPGTITAQANCRAGAPDLHPVSASAPVSAGSLAGSGLGTALASCPAGEQAVAGGFTGQVDGSVAALALPIESRRAPGGTGWQVTAANVAPAASTVSAYAYCSRVPAASVAEVASSPAAAAADARADATASTCPKVRTAKKKSKKGKKSAVAAKKKKTKLVPSQVVAGGFSVNPPSAYPPPNLTGIFASQRSSGGWAATALALGVPGSLTSYAYCAA